jgi:hypothetical protein
VGILRYVHFNCSAINCDVKKCVRASIQVIVIRIPSMSIQPVPAHKVPTEWFLPKGSYRNVPAKKVPTKKVPVNIGPGEKIS